jgi:hypothetical protein
MSYYRVNQEGSEGTGNTCLGAHQEEHGLLLRSGLSVGGRGMEPVPAAAPIAFELAISTGLTVEDFAGALSQGAWS